MKNQYKMGALTTLRLMPSTKSEVKSFTEILKAEILSGYENPLSTAILLKALEDVVSSLRKDSDIEEVIMNEASKYNEKTFETSGAKFTIQLMGVKYNYDKCEDSTWSGLNDNLNVIKGKMKERESVLKAHPNKWVDADTGEVIYPAPKTGKEKVTITLI